MLTEVGTTSTEWTTASSLLANAHVTIDGHELPSWGIAEQALMRLHSPNAPSTVAASISKAIADLALDSRLFDAGKAAGLTCTNADVQSYVQQQASNAAAAGVSEFNGESVNAYINSPQFADAYKHLMIAKAEERAIVGKPSSPQIPLGPGDAPLVRSWAALQFASHVNVAGLLGVTAGNLSSYL